MSRRLQLRVELGEVARLNQWLKDRFDEGGLSSGLAGNIKLCLNEAVTNAISYGFEEPRRGEVVVELDIAQERVTALLVDDGVAFNPLEAPVAKKIESLETAQIGGFGIKLMRDLSSSLSYERVDGRNRLTLRFDRNQGA